MHSISIISQILGHPHCSYEKYYLIKYELIMNLEFQILKSFFNLIFCWNFQNEQQAVVAAFSIISNFT